jgi:hypothetical protein
MLFSWVFLLEQEAIERTTKKSEAVRRMGFEILAKYTISEKCLNSLYLIAAHLCSACAL